MRRQGDQWAVVEGDDVLLLAKSKAEATSVAEGAGRILGGGLDPKRQRRPEFRAEPRSFSSKE